MMPIRTMLVDDNPEFLRAATNFLRADPQIEFVGQATSGREAIEQVSRLWPDVVIMDMVMPNMSGLKATEQIKAQPEPPYIIILTLYDDPEYRAEAQRVNADGFIPKSDFGTRLLPLIHSFGND